MVAGDVLFYRDKHGKAVLRPAGKYRKKGGEEKVKEATNPSEAAQ